MAVRRPSRYFAQPAIVDVGRYDRALHRWAIHLRKPTRAPFRHWQLHDREWLHRQYTEQRRTITAIAHDIG